MSAVCEKIIVILKAHLGEHLEEEYKQAARAGLRARWENIGEGGQSCH